MLESENKAPRTDTAIDRIEGNMEGTNKVALGRLGWRSRCREMKGVNRRRKGDKNENNEERKRERIAYTDAEAHNPEFEQYYKDQGICKDSEWHEFLESTKKSLPIAFRVNTCIPLWRRTVTALETFGKTYSQLELTTALEHTTKFVKTKVHAPLYYQLATDKATLRKNEQVVTFRKWLIDEDNRGTLARQETVSMLPVIYLDPQPHENILDICAAPGMKFLQILDAVNSTIHYKYRQTPCNNTGIIVGNDVCQQRVSTLVHNVKAINCPSATVTNYDAARFPYMYNEDGQRLLFDRVLADVPCSCDGTMRKAPELWKSWKTTGGLHMHRLQLSIVKRAMQLLKPGGTMVYSTCSLNPLENEAIASYVASEGRRLYDVELVPIEPIPGFKVAPGLDTWKVPNPDGGYFNNYQDVPEQMRNRVTQSMFKAPEWNENVAKGVIRVLPHYNDTGGFFLFKVRKKSENNDKEYQMKQEIKPVDVAPTYPNPKWIARKRGEKLLHDYVLYSEAEPKLFDDICQFYGIKHENRQMFNRMLVTKRYSHNHAFITGQLDSAALYQKCKATKLNTHVSAEQNFIDNDIEHDEELKPDMQETQDNMEDEEEVQENNAIKTGYKRWERCRFAMVGIRAFVRLDSKATRGSQCVMRVAQESTIALLEFMSRRVMFANIAFCAEFIKGNMKSQTLVEQEQIGNIHSLDPCRRDGVLESGGCIVIVVPGWARNRIPAKGITITSKGAVNVDQRSLGSDYDISSMQVPVDILDTMPVSCVISDMGELFAYASPYVMNALRNAVAELESQG
ncbi:tRNA (cytosine(34)-C(5))-methyltransferase [Babesia sp. Xinjiang]|uniref:tRNA (cytosine(34)-C(5))-methyltransferase n=1 Tax=Babesia sp. Xinjiang TaxID=462227 RepID=UPI000A234B6A|nr:tRNA (cytosine(34)-C(5))-methyltransferase [Babesia sp. Xinjiang]ORM40436.1 tRNA (cytosine(34)-C(5))-methyltransferase [Babesia sp. Xinjiang]